MRIAVISSVTYRACLPDDPFNMCTYGSEPYHAVLVKALLDRGHEVEWYAPHGSTEFREYDNCHFHPLIYTNGIVPEEIQEWTVNTLSLDHSKLQDLLGCDFVIDMTMHARDIEEMRNFHGYMKYIAYRNGYAATPVPRVNKEDKHFAVPSIQNQKLFKEIGFDSDVVYYGIPDHYSPGFSQEYWNYWDKKGLTQKEYWLYPHRPTPEKGLFALLYLAKHFPDEIFILSCSTPAKAHYLGIIQFMRQVKSMTLDNIAYVPSPENNLHHFYKRELYRNAKAMLAPFDPNTYREGFGLTTAECIASGTPAIITDSESTRELWIKDQDGIFCDSTGMFEMALRHFSSYDLKPTNRYTTDKYAQRYEELIKKYV
jgi:glycosyltransferase involved in cell wall biosynthesis